MGLLKYSIPKNKIILAAHLGDMTQKAANEVVKQTYDRIKRK
jgi:hypothetical protein